MSGAEIVLAVAEKLMVVAPPGTVTDPCTGSRTGLLLISPTWAPLAGGRPESVTKHAVVWFELRLVGKQATLVNVGRAGGTNVMVADRDVLL